jgi:seryl-tRNA(Sec) selenium transferase
MKREFVIQNRHRYGFDPLYTVSGGKLVEAGDRDGCTKEQLDAAIGPRTAAVVYQVRPDWDESLVSLEDAVDIAHRHKVPVIADAASQVYPLDYMVGNARAADLVCFGGKYIRSETDTGFVCGKADYIEAVKANGFIPFETGPAGSHGLGRGMKVAHGAIVGMAVAVEEWLSTDHDKVIRRYERRLTTIARALAGIRGVHPELVRYEHFVHIYLFVRFDTQILGKTSQQIAAELDGGSPRIKILTSGRDALQIGPDGLNDGEEYIVAYRLREVLEVR